MLLGLVLFGISTMYFKQRGAVTVLSDERAQLFAYVFIALAAVAIGVMMLIRSRITAADEPRKVMMQYIIGYAVAESAALFGAVTWFLGGAKEWFVAGLIVMVVAFQILPVKREA
jgi:F0F1-type ATP synthase membrane subunit c/vacuolar-type H+-ATPase subunit K